MSTQRRSSWSADQWADLAWQLAQMPDVVRSLLVTHRPDQYGRCVVCSPPGSPTGGRVIFPCALQRLATDAATRWGHQ